MSKLYQHSTTCATLSNIRQYNEVFSYLLNSYESSFTLFYLLELFHTPSLYCNEDTGSCWCFHSLLPSEVSQHDAPPSGHTAEGGRLDVPVFNRIGKQTDAWVQVLLGTVCDGTEVVDTNTADFVGMEVNHLNRQKGSVCLIGYCSASSVNQLWLDVLFELSQTSTLETQNHNLKTTIKLKTNINLFWVMTKLCSAKKKTTNRLHKSKFLSCQANFLK